MTLKECFLGPAAALAWAHTRTAGKALAHPICGLELVWFNAGVFEETGSKIKDIQSNVENTGGAPPDADTTQPTQPAGDGDSVETEQRRLEAER
eukprot:gene15344-21430_t